MGELMSVLNPALSSSPRPKRHYRGRPVESPGPSVDAFACNEARLLVAVFGYQIMHAQRVVLERATGTGWSLRRLLERVLRAPARFTVSGRRIAMIASTASRHWQTPRPPASAPPRTGRLAPTPPAPSLFAVPRTMRKCLQAPENGVVRSPKTPFSPSICPPCAQPMHKSPSHPPIAPKSAQITGW